MLSIRLLCPAVASLGNHDMHSRASADEIRSLTVCVRSCTCSTQIKSQFCRYRASEQCAACVMSVLRVLPFLGNADIIIRGTRDWSPQLAYYTGYSRQTIAVVADRLLAEAVDVSAKIVNGFTADVSNSAGSFRKRYDQDFLVSIHQVLCQAAAGAVSQRPAIGTASAPGPAVAGEAAPQVAW